jgi:aspartyl-tRNA(Asn)/glutamyl-tRNA(Gln) amidotransferase subunit A|nr:Asp-tRNA(Asn)/Glu-tRNA(Gln) amidotransferase subunit GatA [Kofleriaceae bacterium]
MARGVLDIARGVAAGETTATAEVDACYARIAARDGELGAYLAVDADAARAAAAAVDRARAAGQPLGPLAGVPISIKDNIVTRGLATTAGSKMLAGWIPPYDAHAVARLRAAGAIVVGKTNCDEFGMGSSTETSAFHPTRNPWDATRVPGGSSGGSAAAVAADLCAGSLGTDTGGSIRQPAALCGVVGIKPTYGRVSRYGAIAYASSLDQIGPLARSVADAAALLEVIAGRDPRDATSLAADVPDLADAARATDVRGLRVGLPREYFAELDPHCRGALDAAIAALRDAGATAVDVSLPHTHLAIPAYYVIAPAEASSNLARYDGVRYGVRADARDLLELYTRTRAGFGTEVKRRIMLGTYALRSGYYDAFYKKAQQVRTLIARDFEAAWASCDLLLAPTTPGPAWRFGERATPLDMYRADIYTLSCNLAGLPGASVPCGLTSQRLPIGAQLIGQPLDEPTVIRAAAAVEARVGFRGLA